MAYIVDLRIMNETDNAGLDTLLFLKDTYPSVIQTCCFNSTSKDILTQLRFATFEESVTAISVLKTRFGDNLEKYNLLFERD